MELSLARCKYSYDWNTTNDVIQFKPDNPNDVKKYRPLSLIGIVDKVMERSVHKHVLIDNHVASSYQSDLIKRSSVVNQLLGITYNSGRALVKKKKWFFFFFFCDIRTPFNQVWHIWFLHKLGETGLRAIFLNGLKVIFSIVDNGRAWLERNLLWLTLRRRYHEIS